MEANNWIAVLQEEMNWLQQVIDQALCTYLMQDGYENSWRDIPVPNLSEKDCPYAAAVSNWNLNVYARLALVLAMAPHVRPEVLDIFFGKNQVYDRGFTEFGGVVDKSHSGFLPTGQTLCFLATVDDPALRLDVMSVLSTGSILINEQVLSIGDIEAYLPRLNGVLSLSDHWFHYFMTGQHTEIENSPSFPAQKISTKMDWKDIVLNEVVMEQVEEINTWIEHGETLMNDWGLSRKIKPGYRALFYGPPGTGKTLTATLIGKASGRGVYRVDLSMIVSKYIGETEKNLAKLFDTAQQRNWILFFDEADALFGKRTSTNSSNDRYANEQTAYLLQRVEDFPGIVILASNLRANMDDAFTRRFQAIIHFTMPTAEQRYQLWQHAFSGVCTLHPDIDVCQVAEEYELAGGSIINILRFCALSVIRRNDTVVSKQELMAGIKREFKKENKTMNVANI
jgi:AAA+ superfamily predicted ATPase